MENRSGVNSRLTEVSGKNSVAANSMTSLQNTQSPRQSAKPRRPIKTALHQAVLDCRLHQVRLLVSKHGVNVDCKDLNGRTPMMLACMIDEEFGYRMAKIFLGAGAFLNLRDYLGRTALSYASMNGRASIVSLILKEDVLDINEADNDGNTPLHHAALSGNPTIVELLADCFVKFGLDIDTRNSLGYTALLLALKHGHFVSAHFLLKRAEASPSLRDNEVFLNAAEWAQRGSEGPRKYTPRRSAVPVPASATTLSFSREYTMYQPPSMCTHGRRLPEGITWSAATLRLPSVSGPREFERSETVVNGRDARQLVLDEIEDTEAQQRPISYRRHERLRHPSTAKLLALSSRSKTTIVPDMTTLFKIYSEQYQPDWMKKPSFSRSNLDLSYGPSSRASSEVTSVDVA
ncbi:hypothetical protein FSP39_005121 [Pinctada imbricata]|uniref:Uncharacterized protein n=1 Tax=Pinctada imbricata TaxID=66713 RepID=A0AA89C0J8_PINIB|nr:hypothetical protein FSP39_005121 [Pinctada imbricata]